MSVPPVILGAKRGSSTGVTYRLPDSLETYLRWHRIEGHTDATVRHYRQELGLFLRWLKAQGHSLLVGDLSPMDILGHMEDMKRRGLSPRSVDTQLRDIRAWIHWMQDWEIISHDPCQRIKPPKVPKVRKPFIKQEQFEALLDLCPLNTLLGARRQAMMWLMITSGIRRREMSLLELADLDWDGETIRVIFGKGQKERSIPFTRDVQKVMLRYLRQRKDSLSCLWVTEEGRQFAYYGIGLDLKRLQRRAGVDLKDACHIFRRSFAAASVRQNIPHAYIRAKAGWTSNQMIEKYVSWMEEEEAEANARYRGFQPFRA